MSFEFDLIGDEANRPRPLSLNESAMLRLRQLLSDLGLLDFDFDRGPWPEGEGPEAEDRKAVFLAQHDDNAKVPHYKFRTNDNWVLTPTECRALYWGLAEYRNHEDPEWEQLVRRFCARCWLGAETSGLEVY